MMMLAGIIVGAAAAGLVFLLVTRKGRNKALPGEPWLGRRKLEAPVKVVPGVMKTDPSQRRKAGIEKRSWSTLTN